MKPPGVPWRGFGGENIISHPLLGGVEICDRPLVYVFRGGIRQEVYDGVLFSIMSFIAGTSSPPSELGHLGIALRVIYGGSSMVLRTASALGLGHAHDFEFNPAEKIINFIYLRKRWVEDSAHHLT